MKSRSTLAFRKSCFTLKKQNVIDDLSHAVSPSRFLLDRSSSTTSCTFCRTQGLQLGSKNESASERDERKSAREQHTSKSECGKKRGQRRKRKARKKGEHETHHTDFCVPVRRSEVWYVRIHIYKSITIKTILAEYVIRTFVREEKGVHTHTHTHITIHTYVHAYVRTCPLRWSYKKREPKSKKSDKKIDPTKGDSFVNSRAV